ncbi:MAG: MFS transporter [Chloroflexi bacterium]|nr:MFS transporter [Chloroflexota bacterium]
MMQRLIFLAMLAGVFVAASDLTVVSTILPQVIFDLEIPLRTGLGQAAWIVNAYLIAYTVTMPAMGRISDIAGRRGAFFAALALFAVGSLVAGLARALDVMIAGRALQALGAGAMVPVTMAFVADAMPPARRPWALGIVGAVDTAGWVVGPLYGAAMVVLAQWRWLFFINLPFSLLIAFALWRLMRPQAAAERPAFTASRDWRTLDLPGLVLSTVALVALTLAFTGTQDEGGGSLFAGQSGLSPWAGPLVALALLTLAAFVWRERSTPHPLIDVRLFADRTFSAACLANFFVGAALIIAMVNVPLFINIAVAPTIDAAPLQSGLALAAFTLGMVAGSLVGGASAGRAGYRWPAVTGLILAGAGFILMSGWRMGVTLGDMALPLALGGAGIGFVISPLASAVINSAGETQRGVASSLVLIMRLIGMALGLAVLTTWGIGRLNTLTAALPPVNFSDSHAARLLFEQTRLVSVQVLAEIFGAAAAVCAVACLPALLMRDRLTGSKTTSWLGWR